MSEGEEDVKQTTEQDEAQGAAESSTGDSSSEEMKRLQAENARLKEHLQNQAKKRKSLLGIDSAGMDDAQEPDAKLSVLEQKLNTLEQKVVAKEARYEEKAMDYLYSQEWGKKYSPTEDVDAKRYEQLSKAFKSVSEIHPIATEEDFKRNLRMADAVVEGKLVDDKKSETIDRAARTLYQKSSLQDVGGSNENSDEKVYINFTPEELALLKRRGIDPKKVGRN